MSLDIVKEIQIGKCQFVASTLIRCLSLYICTLHGIILGSVFIIANRETNWQNEVQEVKRKE